MSDLKLCENHKQEWKQSHYAEHNCDYCKLEKENQQLKAELEKERKLCDDLYKERQLYKEVVKVAKEVTEIHRGNEPEIRLCKALEKLRGDKDG